MTAADVALPMEANLGDDCGEERALIESAKRDPQAMALLYRRHQPRISRYILRRLGDEHEAEDLTANVFLAMVAALPRYRCGKTPLAAWLYRIATNEIHAWIRRRRLRRFLGLSDELAAQRDCRDECEAVRCALAELPLHFQTAVALHHLEELSIEEVSQITRVPPGTVKSRLSRGRELLRAKLTK
jgi:RNA polymerase sigma-70 factor (ECF subfamily)